jgi:choline-glycine betaine transporter
MKRIKPLVFWPPFIFICLCILWNFVDKDGFVAASNAANSWILSTFDRAFVWGALLILAASIFAAVMPFGRTRIGGPKAQPLLKPWNWVAVALCTNTAVGILFWASAEPMYHINYPPKSLGLIPGSPASGEFALSTLFMHWSFIPCAIYALPAIMFAFGFYNMKGSFSLSTTLAPLIGMRRSEKMSGLIDTVCLYALVAGMAASLATGVLTLSGGLEHLYGIESNPLSWMLVTFAIVATFILSASTGLHRGISFLSSINMWVFFLLAGFVLVAGPTLYILTTGSETFIAFLQGFLRQATFSGFQPDDLWPRDWTVFYWANWLAWAPVTAVFLGRIGYGYTIRANLLVNLVVPAVFAIVWMSIFGGTAIHMELLQGLGLSATLKDRGPEGLIYQMFAQFPLAKLLIPLFLFSVFISYVSGADANTSAMAGMSSKGISQENTEPANGIKFVWGAAIGIISVVMLTAAGIDGIKMMSNLGGLPALFFELAVAASVVVVALRPWKYDVFAQETAGKTPEMPGVAPVLSPAAAAAEQQA